MEAEKPGRPLRPLDLLFFFALGSMLAAAVFFATGRWLAGAALSIAALVIGYLTRRASRRSPEPMPHALRWLLLLPRGVHSPRHLLKLLQPLPGEHILEVGPGIGVHAIPVAQTLSPGGSLVAVDLQQAMLDDLAEEARRVGADTITTLSGDAQHLPCADGSFDAAYLICVLGEVPNRSAAFAELRRVLKEGGRLVVGEMAVDPDFISQAELTALAGGAHFRIERVLGSRLSYLALLRVMAPDEPRA